MATAKAINDSAVSGFVESGIHEESLRDLRASRPPVLRRADCDQFSSANRNDDRREPLVGEGALAEFCQVKLM